MYQGRTGRNKMCEYYKGGKVFFDPLRPWLDLKINWERQINREKCTNLFSVSFMWHRNLCKEVKTPRNRPECPCARYKEEGQSCEIGRPETVTLVPPGWHSAGPVCEHEGAPLSSRYKAPLTGGFWTCFVGKGGRKVRATCCFCWLWKLLQLNTLGCHIWGWSPEPHW